MNTAPDLIRITRGRGGQVEVEGSVDSLAGQLLARAGFLSEPALGGRWIRLPFDMGTDWENARATWAAHMLSAARFPVELGPELSPRTFGTAQPAAMSTQSLPPRTPKR
ncbi:hypothetical protein [Streptomyces sp. NPDC006863]|uniref:hypothetical protein n=1 Tax=unclassified Streptomyces TaxID=2593676 RepID=UPI0033FCE63C